MHSSMLYKPKKKKDLEKTDSSSFLLVFLKNLSIQCCLTLF